VRLGFAIGDSGALTAKLTAKETDEPIEVALLVQEAANAEILTQAIQRSAGIATGAVEASIQVANVRSTRAVPKIYWLVGRWGWDTAAKKFTDSLRISLPSGVTELKAAPVSDTTQVEQPSSR
jgi:hypothetical protein